ncbi:MAG: DNA-binding Lrp family transcriptional regulator [Candidatus Nitrosomirales archaeon]
MDDDEDDFEIEDLTSKVFRIVVENGKDGILQSELWKELSLTSRDGSRLAIRLERRLLIKREKVLENGRWTYKLIAIRLPVDTSCIEQAPCLTCPVEHMCTADGTVSPNTCVLIENWILGDITRTEQLININAPSKKYAPARG